MESESLGMVAESPRLVDYDERWPARFQDLRVRILDVAGDHVHSVHHVGSTSVPGLAAKPILDVLVGVGDFEESLACVPILAEIGLEFGPEDDIEDRHYFRGHRDGLRTHHVSLAHPGSQHFLSALAFRDALRASSILAAEYASLKARLYREHAPGTPLHHGKTDFVRRVLEAAGD